MEVIQTAEVDGFYQNDISIKLSWFICNVNHVINKRT